MARFYAEIEGQSRKPVHRLGSPNSGARAVVRSWDAGVSVYADVNDDGEETFTIYLTGGSGSDVGRRAMIAQVVDGKITTDPLDELVEQALTA